MAYEWMRRVPGMAVLQKLKNKLVPLLNVKEQSLGIDMVLYLHA